MHTNLGKAILHWICRCGQYNQDSRPICLDCGLEQPENVEFVSSHGNSKVIDN